MNSQAIDVDVLGTAPTDFVRHEVRKGGDVVVLVRGIRSEAGATVATRVYPTTAAKGDDAAAIDRSFAFPSVDQARGFVDETLTALEYLGCAIA